MAAVLALCLAIAAGMWGVACWVVFHEPNHDAHAWAIAMLIVGAAAAFVAAFFVLVGMERES